MNKQKSKLPSFPRGPVPQVSTEDFAAMLGGADVEIRRFQTGEEVTGFVVRVEQDVAYLDLGGKSEGILSLVEFAGTPAAAVPGAAAAPEKPAVKVGDQITAYVVAFNGESVRLAVRIGRNRDNLEMLERAHEANIPVSGRVVAVNKGGYEVDLGGARGFCPHSQMDTRFVERPEVFLEQEFEFRINEIREGGRNVILSRRALLEEVEAKKREETMGTLAPGQDLPGRVSNLRPFGAFVDLGGVEGLVHISEISHRRVDDPAELLRVGQDVMVRVLSVEEGGRRISLSMKSLEVDPWETVEDTFPVGTRVEGKVVRLQPFGAFVSLAPGIDGLLHISALAPGRRINHPKDVVSEGQTVEVVVTAVDSARQRVSLELAGAEAMRSAAAEADVLPAVGSVVTGLVDKVETFGVFVRLGASRTGLIPRSELDVNDDRDLRALFPKGTPVEAKLIEIDEARRRYTLSRRALREDDERQSAQGFSRGSSQASGSGESAGGLGTLGDLLRSKLQQRPKG